MTGLYDATCTQPSRFTHPSDRRVPTLVTWSHPEPRDGPRRRGRAADQPGGGGPAAGRGPPVVSAYDGPGAVAAFEEHHPDLVVLDVMLPGFDGLEVCRRIQQQRPVPVLMLTARDDESDVLVGLGVGADDYLTKPFRMRELVARVARCCAASSAPTAAGARGAADAGARRRACASTRRPRGLARRRRGAPDADRVRPAGTPAPAPGQVLTRERLLAEVWGWDGGAGATRTVDSHVKALRAKIGAERVRTVHGVGYALEDRVTRPASVARAARAGSPRSRSSSACSSRRACWWRPCWRRWAPVPCRPG